MPRQVKQNFDAFFQLLEQDKIDAAFATLPNFFGIKPAAKLLRKRIKNLYGRQEPKSMTPEIVRNYFEQYGGLNAWKQRKTMIRPIQNKDIESDLYRGVCKVCLAQYIQIVFRPCQHACVCVACEAKMEKAHGNDKKCPVCKQVYTCADKIYT